MHFVVASRKEAQADTNRIETEDSNDLVPFTARVWIPCEFFCECFCKVFNAITNLQSGIANASYTTCEGLSWLSQRMSAILLVEHKLANGYIVRWIKWQTRHRGWGGEDHRVQISFAVTSYARCMYYEQSWYDTRYGMYKSGLGSDRPTPILHQKWHFSIGYRCTHKVDNFFKFIIWRELHKINHILWFRIFHNFTRWVVGSQSCSSDFYLIFPYKLGKKP